MIFNFSSVPNFEENVAKLQDKAGWISMSDYKKYAVENTELCKNEFIFELRQCNGRSQLLFRSEFFQLHAGYPILLF